MDVIDLCIDVTRMNGCHPGLFSRAGLQSSSPGGSHSSERIPCNGCDPGHVDDYSGQGCKAAAPEAAP